MPKTFLKKMSNSKGRMNGASNSGKTSSSKGSSFGGERSASLISDETSLMLYLKEISKTRALSTVDEVELAERIKKNDKEALNKLVQSNLRFVVSVARNYQNQGLPLTDLINEGNIGLIRAAKRFDHTKKYKFISYAVWWIRQAILQALAEQSRIVKLPLNRVGTIHKIGKTASRLEQSLGRTPSTDEIAHELGIEEAEVNETLNIKNSHMSLDAPFNYDDDSKLIDMISDKSTQSPDEGVIDGSLQKAVKKTLNTLSKREEEVVRLYFGIGEDTPHTLEEIGERFNLTRERVRQIKEKAIRRLKHSSRSKRLKIFRI